MPHLVPHLRDAGRPAYPTGGSASGKTGRASAEDANVIRRLSGGDAMVRVH
jgi:hypothetical protein